MDQVILEPYACRLSWQFVDPQPLEAWKDLFSALLDTLGLACTESGSHVIGHIKGLTILPGGGFVRVSKISSRYPPDIEISDSTREFHGELDMALNVIVYGLPLSEARRIVEEVGNGVALQWSCALNILDSSGDHNHDQN